MLNPGDKLASDLTVTGCFDLKSGLFLKEKNSYIGSLMPLTDPNICDGKFAKLHPILQNTIQIKKNLVKRVILLHHS